MKRLLILSMVLAFSTVVVFLPANGAEIRLTPKDDIQKVLDAAQPGDTIILEPGVYYQSLNITKGGAEGKPITLKAAKGGTAIITGAPRPEELKLVFEPYKEGVYRAAVPWQVRRPVLADGLPLYQYKSLDDMLKRKGSRNPDVPAPEDSFYYGDGYLYVRLEGGKDPNKAQIEIGRPNVNGNIRIKANDVVIEGLQLRMGVTVGLEAFGNRIVIRDCYVTGAATGISIHGEYNIVEYCEVAGPVRHNPWVSKAWIGWEYNYGNGIVCSGPAGRAPVIRHCIVYNSFDGIECPTTTSWVVNNWREIAFNLLIDNNDDAIELDTTADRMLCTRVHHNIFINNFVTLSLCAVEGGELLIDHNIAYNSDDTFPWGTLFKLGTPWNPNTPAKGWAVIHNTFVNCAPQSDFRWFGEKIINHINVLFANNIFYVVHGSIVDQALKGVIWGTNLACGPAAAPGKLPNSIYAKDPGFQNWNPLDFRLRADSPAVDAGGPIPEPWAKRLKEITPAFKHEVRGKAPDLGALELGETWQFEKPGPRWALSWRDIPSRPPFPKDFDPLWAGFQK
jgi:hypothetical protein